MPRPTVAIRGAFIVAIVVLVSGAVGYSVPAEVRGLWVVRTSLTTPASAARVVEDARRAGFNTLLVQVRGRGDAYYAGGLEPRPVQLARQPATFDPLADIVAAAHRSGLRVHAWINVNLVASAQDLPSARTHLVNQHPEWLMVPRPLARELRTLDPTSRAYVGKLARWARGQSDEVAGLFASPIHPAAADHLVAVVRDLVSRYELDGIHLDYVRYPTADFDYSRTALEEFRASVLPELDAAERRRLEARLEVDPFAYVDSFPVRWTTFRRSRLTGLVMRLRTTVKNERPDAIFSAAVIADGSTAFNARLQDWPLWLENGVLDVACPMAYTLDASLFAGQIGDAIRAAGPGSIWAGIGAYRLSPRQTVAHIRAAREAGTAGFVLFSYDAMRDVSPGDYLGEVSRSAFAVTAAAGAAR